MNILIRNRRSKRVLEPGQVGAEPSSATAAADIPPITSADPLGQAAKVESLLTRIVVRHGERVIYENVEDEEGNVRDFTVAQYIHYSLDRDNLVFQEPVYNDILREAVAMSDDANFVAETYFVHHDDIRVSKVAIAMTADSYRLPNGKKGQAVGEEDRKAREENDLRDLRAQTNHLLLDFRMDYVERHLKDLQAQIGQAGADAALLAKLLAEYQDMQNMRNKLAKQLGSNIVL